MKFQVASVDQDYVYDVHSENCRDVSRGVKTHKYRDSYEIQAPDADAAARLAMMEEFDDRQNLGEAGFTARVMPCARKRS